MGGVAIAVALGAAGLVTSRDQLRKAKSDVVALTNRLDRLKPASGHEHSDVRQFMIRQELQRVGPVVVLGDSITEAAPLPKTICGHAIVNAGIGGADANFAAKTISALLNGTSPALIVLALGTNDAHPEGDNGFADRYDALLKEASALSPRLAVVTVPSIASDGPLTRAAGFDSSIVPDLNIKIERAAGKYGAAVIDVRDAIDQAGLPAATIDGVHLSSRAYDVWLTSVAGGIRKAMACEAITGAALSTAR
ncbi:SGNH/GDSL hydrolase family protein [Bradyrhizobium sp. B025]|uniref:SGNH/GDSL hydrolase family protein n=1 Tax=Bradyrhizobium sp. B025 TaxID=3344829 RepID=UPI0035D52871